MSDANAHTEAEVRIEALGAGGDGMAQTPHGQLYVPFALPGETVRVRRSGKDRAALVRIVQASPERIAPFCPHHGACGGCRLQHLAGAPYAAFKRSLVESALDRRGVAWRSDVPLIGAHGTGRRRITLHAVMERAGPAAGFMRAMSHDLEALDTCPAVEPALACAPALARAIVAALKLREGRRIDVQATATETGLDVDVRGAAAPSPAVTAALAAVASRFRLARLTLDGEAVARLAEPVVTMGRARVVPPPGAFLQATAAGEAALAAFAIEALSGCRKIADLFCGVGPFALRLAETATVEAFDSVSEAVAALATAHRTTPGLKPLRAQARDLFRAPLTARELAAVDGVLFDPPRQGADAQSRQIAASGVTRVVSVSCDPGTFARDAATLMQGGFTLERLIAVDQFQWTAHVEIAALFTRRGTTQRPGRMTPAARAIVR